MSDGLAVYDLGAGPPLLLIPNPQGMVRTPEADSPLAELLVGLGRRVVSFDPPGAFASSRPPRLGLAEMLACSREALQVAGVGPSVDVVGHSQATLCQLALALAAPGVVRSLVLVGAVDGGWRTTRRAAGMPWCWPLTDPRRWRFVLLATPLAVGRANLGRLKRLQQLYLNASLVDPSLVPPVQVEPGDQRRPPPPRARWQASVRRVDLRPRLGEISAPALVCVGRHDPQTPWLDNAAIAAITPSWRSPTASLPWWRLSSPPSPGNKSRIRWDLRLHHRQPVGASLALSPEKNTEAGTMREIAFLDHPERHQQTTVAPPVFGGKYLSITSFKRDRSGVATPVWFVQEDGRLLVQTDANSGKVKRIRRNPQVLVAPCTATGRPLADPVPARAELLDDAEVGRVERLLAAKYRIDLLIIRPIRALQAALRPGRPRPKPVILAIIPT